MRKSEMGRFSGWLGQKQFLEGRIFFRFFNS